MENTLFSKQCKMRKILRYGTRTALILESEILAGDTPLACHVREISEALWDHAAREYLSVAQGELQALAQAGRGYDFAAHRLRFCAAATPISGRVRLELSLHYIVGGETRLLQGARQIWCAKGIFRLR